MSSLQDFWELKRGSILPTYHPYGVHKPHRGDMLVAGLLRAVFKSRRDEILVDATNSKRLCEGSEFIPDSSIYLIFKSKI